MPTTGGIRTQGRSARVVADVLSATLKLLGRDGYAGLRVDTIAETSGVNKTTIYRRWPEKADLVAAAIRSLYVDHSIPNTGDLIADLTASFTRDVARAQTDEVRGVMRMITVEHGDPEVEALIVDIRARHGAPRRARLEAAIAAGELPRDIDVEKLLIALSGAVFARVKHNWEIVTPDYVAFVVRLLVTGARHGGATLDRRKPKSTR